MPVAMPSPWQHPETKIFYLRVRVPADVRQFDQRELVKKSLRTKDPKVAKQLLSIELGKLQIEWDNLRKRPVLATVEPINKAASNSPIVITEYDANRLAKCVYNDYLDRHVENPRSPREWPSRILRTFSTDGGDIIIKDRFGNIVTAAENEVRRRLKGWCIQKASEILLSHKINVDKINVDRMAYATAENLKQADELLSQIADGETTLWDDAYTNKSLAKSSDKKLVDSPKSSKSVISQVRFADLLEGWNAERRLKPRTVYEWTNVFRELENFIGHDDASKLNIDDLRSWKTELLKRNLSAKTIRDAKLAPIKAVLNWAIQNGKIDVNPTEKVSIEVRRRAGEGRRGFDDFEAERLLTISTEETDPVRRWVPWICAYTGARLSEICQLRVNDVIQIGSVWAIRISAEAGSLKNPNSERFVPIHKKIISCGFLDFVQSTGSDVLFPSLPPDKFGKRGGNGTKVLGRWIRKLGFDDPRLAPNHSWRHRFKTLARRHGIALDIADAITGHRRRTVGDNYGEFELEAMRREIEKIP